MNHTGANPPLNPKTKAVAIIPARYDSVRLPGKALLEIAGKPMICLVVERALAAGNITRAIVATDDDRIVAAVRSAGYEAVMTSANHRSGTDRIAEVAASLDDVDIIVNVQGDEPLISPETIERAVEAIGEEGKRVKGEPGHDAPGIVTTWEPIESADEVLNPDVVKIVLAEGERAIYFSRSPVPYPRDAARQHGSIKAALEHEPGLLAGFRKHTGLYVYRREVLLAFAKWPQSELERTESLEQLRALEHGVVIKAIKASTASIGVDTLSDLERVRGIVEKVSSFEFQVSS
ncbi:MAG TPA: 3-deoxy-manno-octulosonate cytidylyltransferase [Pyrinomonadaceae bacterium]|nr:3-deoxy-manno-octulosonate cytidylyltransferase [Pyrinomonadaceae bacterium]